MLSNTGFTPQEEGKFIADNALNWAEVREMLKARHLSEESAEFKNAVYNVVVSIVEDSRGYL